MFTSSLVSVYAQLILTILFRGLLDTDILTPEQAEELAEVCFTSFCLFKINWPVSAAMKLSYVKCITGGDRYTIPYASTWPALLPWLLFTAVLSLLYERVSPESTVELARAVVRCVVWTELVVVLFLSISLNTAFSSPSCQV